MGDKELCLIDNNITSLSDIQLSPTVSSLNLHCNRIEKIEGLASAWHLRHLDLSSNRIFKIEGLSSITSLRTVNLSCNLISTVEGLTGLVNLTRLNLSYNQINNLSGLLYLHGPGYQLKHLGLHSNCLDDLDHVLQCLLGLTNLREVTLNQDGNDNAVCRSPGYREMVLQSLPQISVLDGVNRLGHSSGPSSLCDIPGVEDYVDLLLSSDQQSPSREVAVGDCITTTRIEPFVSQFCQGIVSQAVACLLSSQEFEELQPVGSTGAHSALEQRKIKPEQQCKQQVSASKKSTRPIVWKAKRDIDYTSESECDSRKEIRRRSRIPKLCKRFTSNTKTQESKAKISDSEQEKQKQKTFRFATGPGRKGSRVESSGTMRKRPAVADKASQVAQTRSTQDEETYRAIVEERDHERERRWRAEQAVRKLTEEMKLLQTTISEEKDLQSMAMHTTDRLKDILLKERSGRCGLQARVKELEEKCRTLTQQLEQARRNEEQHQVTLQRVEASVSQGEAVRARQQVEEMKRQQELENKTAALRRELDIQRASVHQHKEKLQKLHELLASREQEHRQQLNLRFQPGGADFQEAVAKAMSSAQHSRREAELQEKVDEGKKQYAALEDEFRMALTIEAARFNELKEACEQSTAKLMEVKSALKQSQQNEKKSTSFVQELTALVKEQKDCISALMKEKKDKVAQLKRQLHTLEAQAGRDRRLDVQLELLRKEKAKLLSQVTAQESVIDGLRAERKHWGEELAQQGASLAQDRGLMQARIEVLTSELDSQKKQAEKDSDTLKIKSRIIDDQTETILKLKESVQERDKQIRRQQEEAVGEQRRLQKQLEEETSQQAELRERLEQLSLCREDLKQQLGDREEELMELRKVYSDSSKKWQEKADLLTFLESQVRHMKDNFDSKERLLLEEREKATEEHNATVEKLHSQDDAFRRQLKSIQAKHQAELLCVANEKDIKIQQANQKVIEVEDEMRQLLAEVEANKRITEEKMRRLNSFLKDF